MVATPEQSAKLVCSFCGKSQDEVRKLISGPTVYICDDCIYLCNDKSPRRLAFSIAWAFDGPHFAGVYRFSLPFSLVRCSVTFC